MFYYIGFGVLFVVIAVLLGVSITMAFFLYFLLDVIGTVGEQIIPKDWQKKPSKEKR